MFCKKCGKYSPSGKSVCPFCGGSLGETSNVVPVETQVQYGESKKLVGFLLGFFLGIIGLIIGICIYPSGSYERSSCIKGWIIAFAVDMVIGVIVGIVFGSYIMALLNQM